MSKLRLAAPCLALSVAALLGAPSAPNAQISPAPHTFTLSGPLTFTQMGRPPVSCAITMTIAVDPGGLSGAVTNFTSAPGHLFCAGLASGNLPWPVVRLPPSPTPQLQISSVKIVGVFGFCDSGTLNVEWLGGSPGAASVTTQGVMPGNWNGNPYPAGYCALDGLMNVTAGGPVSVS